MPTRGARHVRSSARFVIPSIDSHPSDSRLRGHCRGRDPITTGTDIGMSVMRAEGATADLLQQAQDSPLSTPDRIGRDLAAARDAARLTQDDVAAALGVSRQMIGYWEKDTRKPRQEHLLGMARVYGISVEELLGRTPTSKPDANTASMLYRRSNVLLDEEARRGLREFIEFLDFYARLGRAMGRDVTGMTQSPFVPGPGYADYDVDARRKASEVRAYLGLGQGPVPDVDTVCATLGVTVCRAHLGDDLNKTISGAFFRHSQIGFTIVINADMTQGRRRFTAAHELAHALLHSGSEGIIVSDKGRSGEQREKFADAFAGEFLMPEEGIRRALETLGYGPKLNDVEPVIHLQRMFNVSYITALVRLRQARIISNASLQTLRRIPPVSAAAALGYSPDASEWPLDPHDSVLVRYPLRFRSLLREADERGIVGESEIRQALGLNHDEYVALVMDHQAGPAKADETEWNEFEALGAFA